MGTMSQEEAVAYSVQELGGAWRWRIYAAHGRVMIQGVEIDAARAERTALAAFWGQSATRRVA